MPIDNSDEKYFDIMSKKRRREIPAVDVQLIEMYEDLASSDEEVRLKAAQNLMLKFSLKASLKTEQKHEILRRLIRGLCSGRKAARLGFSIALTEAQIQLFGPNASNELSFISIAEFIEMLKKQTYCGGSVSGQVIQVYF